MDLDTQTERKVRSIAEWFYSAVGAERLSDAEGKQWGWLAVRVIKDGSGTIFASTGACVVGSRWLLTARHCKVMVGDLYAVGSSRLESSDNLYSVVGVEVPPGAETLGGSTDWPDVKLVELGKEIRSAYLGISVGIPKETTKEAYLITWGPWSLVLEGMFIEMASKEARKKELTVVRTYGAEDRTLEVVENGGICKGDSGSPLVVEEDGVWSLLGVASEGNFCAGTNRGRLTYMPFLEEWVKSVTSG